MRQLLIIDDHRLFADGLRFMLAQTPAYAVAGMVHTVAEVMPFLARHPVDLLLLDVDLPDGSGIELAEVVRAVYPTLPMLAVSMLDDISSVRRMMQAGATGYCVKSAGYDELLAGLACVSAGTPYLPAAYLQQLQNRQHGLDRTSLTDREVDIVQLVAQGIANHQIADRLCLSTRTVETHRKNIYRKLGVHNNVELIRFARQHCLL
ncbi:LuxR C-terminal-related transcriptional regulator [Fibrella aquatilis]|uniref:Response regulator transcription factor n=1 Tax=Fibrella aquatilis TaxID=2817059 RepID=A0A939G7K8_9BACT|nr:response regulator transcription factor [Fibrella aquatilis]MBO0933346.1 response regulator transcription factor [Fibrella aquatilis]